jgi:hypothetical protein
MKSSFLVIYFLILLFACSSKNIESQSVDGNNKYADVTNVSIRGDVNNYTFSVTLSSPDSGCKQYADWWEVISEGGDLIYRRILGHSHTAEQPFTRSGGKVDISANQTVWIRAHMNNNSYGGITFKGSQVSGFNQAEMPEGFALDLEKAQPLPDGCAF